MKDRAYSRAGALQLVGKLFIAFVPLLVAFGVGVGVFAAATYNEGVDAYVKP